MRSAFMRWPAWLRWAPAYAFFVAFVSGAFIIGAEMGADLSRREALVLAQILGQ